MEIDNVSLSRLYGYSIDDLKKNDTSGNYNQTFIFRKDGIPYILRVSPSDEDVNSLNLCMNYLAKHHRLGSAVVEPIKSLHGNFVEQVTSANGSVHCVTVTKYEPGTCYELLNANTLNNDLLRHVGRSLGAFHNNSRKLGDQGHDAKDWHEGNNCFSVMDFGTAETEMVSLYMDYKRTCLDKEKTDLTYGIIHGDLHFSNIIIESTEPKVTFCDFDNLCRGYYAMDLAMILFDLSVILQCSNKEKVLTQKVTEIVEEYNAASEVRLEIEDTSDFLKLLEISLYIHYHQYFAEDTSDEGWLSLFFPDRRRRIVADIPVLSG